MPVGQILFLTIRCLTGTLCPVSTTTAKRAVRVWLAQHEKSQAWLAREIPISEGLLSTILNGYKRSEPVADRIEEITGINIRRFKKVA